MALRERERSRARERLEALAGAELDPEDACRAAIEVLRRAVGFERWCWPLTDPGSGLATSGTAEFDLWPEVPRLAVLEEYGDITSKPRLVVGPRASITLSAATGGRLERSRRWRECLRPYGVGDELMTVCRDRHGCWGSVELMRDAADRAFADEDADLLDRLAPTLARLVRRSQRRRWQADARVTRPLAPATLILDPALQPTSWTASFRDWSAELPMLPPAVYELGARVLTPSEEASGLPATVRIRTQAGRWATLEGAPLEGATPGHVAITIRAASPDEVFDLLCMTYDFTRRERQLVALVLDGLATKQLAQAMSISQYTVQDHLKAVFGKTGLRSRRELISHLAGRVPARGAA
jgi:DNA-binding CsgD family transcriptional regulator